MMQELDNAVKPLAGLCALNQWVVWKLIYRDGKPTKIPFNAVTGQPASSTDPSTWCSYCEAVGMLAVWNACGAPFNGLGFVLTAADPFGFIDLDDCVADPSTGTLKPDAVAICSALIGAAWEWSVSGKGLHIVGRVDAASIGERRKKWSTQNGQAVECYTAERFIAFGPHGWQGDADTDITEAVRRIVPEKVSIQPGEPIGGASGPHPDWRGPADDEDLIRRMIESKGGPAVLLGRRPAVSALWYGDGQVIGAFYPCPSGKRQYDQSKADQTLMNDIAFWCGKHSDRMLRLFNRSALALRDKWKQRADYRERVVREAINSTRDVYRGNRVDEIENAVRTTPEFTTLDEMLHTLRYVNSEGRHGVFNIKTKRFHMMEIARTVYASSTMQVPKLDATGEPRFDRQGRPVMQDIKILQLWEKDPRRQDVHGLSWLPNGAETCESPDGEAGYANSWRGFRAWPAPRDPAPWLAIWREHLAYLIPNEPERRRFEQWIAHIVQRPEQLPTTGYLFINEEHGTGRDWLGRVLSVVLRGYVADSLNLETLLGLAQFNGTISGKLLGIISEIKAETDGRYQIAQKLRNAIDSKRRVINDKFGRNAVEYNCMRLMFFSNHLDALPFDEKDRRIIVIRSTSEPMDDMYYKRIYGPYNDDNPEFFSAIFHHLASLDLSGFDHAARAEITDAKAEVLDSLMSDVERSVRRFSKEWPGEFATFTQLKQFIDSDLGDGTAARTKQRALDHAIKRAGILSSGREGKIFGRNERIILVRGGHSKETIRDSGFEFLRKAVIDAEGRYRLTAA